MMRTHTHSEGLFDRFPEFMNAYTCYPSLDGNDFVADVMWSGRHDRLLPLKPTHAFENIELLGGWVISRLLLSSIYHDERMLCTVYAIFDHVEHGNVRLKTAKMYAGTKDSIEAQSKLAVDHLLKTNPHLVCACDPWDE